MKKIITTLLLCGCFVLSYGQKKIVWFDAGLKAQFGGTGFVNTSVFDHPDVNYELALSNGYGLGGKLGVNFGYGGLALEGMYFNGSYGLETVNGVEPIPAFEYNNIDIYALYKSNKNLGYFEIGPKVSLLSKMNQGSQDIKSDFNSTNFAGVMGFGANLIGGDGAFTGMLGLRFEYGFSDWVSDAGKSNNAPIGRYINDYTNTTSTNPFFAGLVFELNWGIGYFGVAQCGQRAKFIRF